jgi:hypothetical protein
VLDPALVDAFVRLGATGFALIAVWGYATGRVRVGGLVDKDREAAAVQAAKDQAELLVREAEWRKIAEDALAKLGRLTDVLEATVGKKLE